MLNELGKRTRLCQRERTVTPFRLALSLIEVFASPRVPCIADRHRGFNALCEESVRYKPFHNQLAKRGFAQFMRELQSQLLNELAVQVLRFDPTQPVLPVQATIRIQDCGTPFALKSTQRRQYFPGRLDAHNSKQRQRWSYMWNWIYSAKWSAGSSAQHLTFHPSESFCPEPPVRSRGALRLADRGYYDQSYFQALVMRLAVGSSFEAKPISPRSLLKR